MISLKEDSKTVDQQCEDDEEITEKSNRESKETKDITDQEVTNAEIKSDLETLVQENIKDKKVINDEMEENCEKNSDENMLSEKQSHPSKQVVNKDFEEKQDFTNMERSESQVKSDQIIEEQVSVPAEETDDTDHNSNQTNGEEKDGNEVEKIDENKCNTTDISKLDDDATKVDLEKLTGGCIEKEAVNQTLKESDSIKTSGLSEIEQLVLKVAAKLREDDDNIDFTLEKAEKNGDGINFNTEKKEKYDKEATESGVENNTEKDKISNDLEEKIVVNDEVSDVLSEHRENLDTNSTKEEKVHEEKEIDSKELPDEINNQTSRNEAILDNNQVEKIDDKTEQLTQFETNMIKTLEVTANANQNEIDDKVAKSFSESFKSVDSVSETTKTEPMNYSTIVNDTLAKSSDIQNVPTLQ
uniref:Uncharacterized protein n=1 Tax=Clastoptera arizonana TaxID=38151 RepID=A0A1B6CQ47_9HEMI